MFIPIFIPRRPKTYRKVNRVRVEITGATCKVRTYVAFKEMEVFNERTLQVEHIRPETYGFQTEVELNKDEYLSNRHRLEEYVCSKAKEQRDHQAILEDCLKQQPAYRDYTIEMFLPMDSLDAVEVHTIRYEFEDYVPIN